MLVIAALLLVAVAAGAWLMRPQAPREPFRFGEVSRGTVQRSVSASGTLQALVTVQVGSQVSGLVTNVNVDFNSRVRRGDVLATLDPSTFASQVAQARADVEAQQASLGQQQANLQQAQAQLALDQANYNRSAYLAERGIVARAALDQAQATVARSRAAVGVAQAQINTQRARIAQSRASLAANSVNLGRARILSPIDGVVVDRQVDPGQTVAASLQAPVLFRIAQDLSQVQVKVSVDEADIGQVHEGQTMTFTVDAYPNETFQARVTQVRLQPETTANVVAYQVMAEAPNPNGRLLPGMTANADILIERRSNVLRVPNAALRFTPADQRAPVRARGFGGPGMGGGGRAFGGGGGGGGRGALAGGGAGRGGMRQGGGGGMRAIRQAMEQQMLAELRLTADQQARITQIRRSQRGQMREAFGDPEAMIALRASTEQQILAVLTPQQRPQYQAIQRRLQQMFAAMRSGGQSGLRPGMVYVPGPNNRPRGVPVMVGATDGTNTEIRPLNAADLPEGAQVIVGGGPRPRVQAGSMIPGAGSSGGGGRGPRGG
jgi:HlyD family secretion protein